MKKRTFLNKIFICTLSAVILLSAPACTVNAGLLSMSDIPKESTAPARSSATLLNVKKYNSNKLKITWARSADAAGYMLYRSTREDAGYKCIYTTKNPFTSSYKNKVEKGKRYYYYIRTIFKDGSVSSPSESLSGLLLKKTTEKKYKTSIKITPTVKNGQYDPSDAYAGMMATPDTVCSFSRKSKDYTVLLKNQKLLVYEILSNGKANRKKVIDLSGYSYDLFGGMYGAPDGNLYVALGYKNPYQQDYKTVVTLLKINSKWKIKDEAEIKSKDYYVSDNLQGIEEPFQGGNPSFSMQGKTLYMYTTAYVIEKGKWEHQTSLSYVLNTSTMDAYVQDPAHVSLSFNQKSPLKDGYLFTIDHGIKTYKKSDQRGICITAKSGYNTKSEQSLFSLKNVFSFTGNNGSLYTGTTLGGAELGQNNLLVCGTSVPHNNTIAGISGNSEGYRKNVYLITVNKTTGASSFKWLTNYNPAYSDTTVSECRMVKITDNAFAILYNTIKGNSKKLHCLFVDNNGKTIKSKTYKKVKFDANSQPIVSGSSILWVSTSSGRLITNRIPITL